MKWWSECLEDLLLQPFTGSPDSLVLLSWWAMVHPVWPIFVLHPSRQVVLWWMLEIYIETESLDSFFFCLNENWKTCLLTLNLSNKGFYCCSLSWLLSYFIFIKLCWMCSWSGLAGVFVTSSCSFASEIYTVAQQYIDFCGVYANLESKIHVFWH